MNNKGVIWEDMADLFLGGLILLAAFMIFMLMTGYHEERVEEFFEQKISNLNNDEVFVSYLNAKVNEITLGDYITMTYFNHNDQELENILDSYLEEIYSGKVCWVLEKDNSKWLDKNKCKKEKDLLDSTIIIPLPNNDILKAKLQINGYAT